ncbi:MAG: TetR/AcrR family transcriptional regulator [Bacteroidetes bacterium]|nr:TetR/AcrR family transcriptional regulator [Bacteroidota bacterium]MCB0846572.1 TetR/AcrR family transcriptional regulator [Bacteroidota bacterium]MCB0851541.1 TetR/AcrR family transcriptional regulator [Bacteroidota bacterium]
MRTIDEIKYQRVVDTSIELINQLGLEKVSVNKIAKEAQVSVATLYVYFKDKDSMINQLFIRTKSNFMKAALKDFHPNDPIRPGFQKIWKNIRNYTLKHPQELWFIEHYLHSSMQKAFDNQEIEALYAPLAEFFQRGANEGIFKPIHFKLAWTFSFVPLLFLVKAQLSGKCNLREDDWDEVFRTAWRSVTV